MRSILPTLLASILLLIPANSTPSTSLVNEVERSIVRLDVGNLDGPHGVCTGFVVSSSKGEALTAAHCLPEDGQDLYVDGALSEVVKQNDIFGLVKVPVQVKPALPIRKSRADVGEVVWSFGYAWGQLTVFGRHVAWLTKGDVVIDGPLAPGMSGGPLTDARGEVIGVNQASNEYVGVACGSDEIMAFLKR